MDIWSPPHQRRSDKSHSVSKALASVTLGVAAGMLSGVVISVVVWLVKCTLGWHYPYFASHGYLYFLAVPIEIGLGSAMLPKNKVFVLSCAITAVCVSIVLAAICIFSDGFPELD